MARYHWTMMSVAVRHDSELWCRAADMHSNVGSMAIQDASTLSSWAFR